MTTATTVRTTLSAVALVAVPSWESISEQAAMQTTAHDQLSDDPHKTVALWWAMSHNWVFMLTALCVVLLMIWARPLLRAWVRARANRLEGWR